MGSVCGRLTFGIKASSRRLSHSENIRTFVNTLSLVVILTNMDTASLARNR